MHPTPKNILDSAKLPAVLVSNLVHVRYLTGLDISAGFLLVVSRKMVLFVDSRYTEVAQKSVPKSVRVCDSSEIEKVLGKIASCGCESTSVTLEQMRLWKRKFKNTKFVQKKGIIEEFRRSKTPEELRKFKKAQQVTLEVLDRIPRALKTGVTEQGIVWKIEGWVRELGADGTSFDSIVAFGRNSSRPHHHPTSRKLKKGEMVQIDMGAKYKGYCADKSRVFFTGKKTPQQEKVFNAVQEAKEAAEKAVKVGATTHELDRIARGVLREYNLEQYFTHSLGHGVGLEIHEGVTLSEKAPKKILQKNEIITIEPGVYIPGKFGIRLEDEIVVK